MPQQKQQQQQKAVMVTLSPGFCTINGLDVVGLLIPNWKNKTINKNRYTVNKESLPSSVSGCKPYAPGLQHATSLDTTRLLFYCYKKNTKKKPWSAAHPTPGSR